ncbi:restriction endonuclease S subunit [Staphylococcus aureus]|uniref:restriction endonuclease subunit S n=1 Tax=Staphylococcus cohnii TaxID=29382 RepID=UPI001579EB2D|nr:restriction endonuclease subunit S [Staphylococcus cohnii]CAC8557352.1 restriction endonuclease S subunit [Staphylococcus aureus]
MKPELRFPEFDGEWEEKQLNNIVDSLKGNSNDNEELPVLTISAKKGWLNQKERFSQVIAGNSLSKYNELKKGDLSYNKGNSKVALYGIVYKLNYDRALVPNVYKSFRPKSNYESDFIEKYFHTKILDKQLRKVITSTARMDGLLNISDNDFYSMLINIPTKKEQQKIGEFFSKLDQQIELEEQKLAKLEEQKKGYMQKIFSKELRFKDENGNNYPEWEEKKLKELIDVRDGTHESPKPSKEGYLLVTSKNLKNSKLNLSESYFISKEDYESINQRSKVEIGDILFGMIGTIGNPILLEECDFAIKNVALLKTNDLLEKYYILNFLKSSNISKQFYRMNAGGTQKFIALSTIRDLNIDMPSSEEAIKIGNFFNKVDNLIENQLNKVELLKQRKQSFLQKMFV